MSRLGEQNSVVGSNDPRMLLKIYGSLLILLAVLDSAKLVLEFVGDEIAESIAALGNAGVVLTVVFTVVSVGIILARLWMGIQALRYAKGTGKGTSHITLAKIARVVLVILLVMRIIGWISGEPIDKTDVASELVSLGVIWGYLSAAKACLN